VIARTFYWMALSVSFKMVVGILGAVLLNAVVPGRTLFRVLVMPPWVVPIAIGVFIWGWMYNGQFGMISGVAQRIGILAGPFEFLAYRNSAFLSTIVTDVWVGTPLVTVYLLAAMQSISPDLHEAAWTDGASRLYRFRRITLPLIMPAIATMALLSAIWTFNSFDIIWILTEGGPRNATTTMIIDTYKTAISRFQYGAGAARAVMIVVFLSLFSGFYFLMASRIARREDVQ
jgi:multiple sugar transport system permease protein